MPGLSWRSAYTDAAAVMRLEADTRGFNRRRESVAAIRGQTRAHTDAPLV